MLAARSKEEIVYVEEEMQRFHSGLKNAEKKLEEEFERLVKSEDLFTRGKAFIMQSNIKRIQRLLLDCQSFSPCETIPRSNCFDDMIEERDYNGIEGVSESEENSESDNDSCDRRLQLISFNS